MQTAKDTICGICNVTYMVGPGYIVTDVDVKYLTDVEEDTVVLYTRYM